MSEAKWTAYGAADTLITGADMNSLANGSWATGVDTLVNNGTDLKLYMDIDLALASAVTAGAGSPRVDVYLIPVPNGTNPPNPPGTTAQAAPIPSYVGGILAVASASFTRGSLRGIVIPPGSFGIIVQNNLGVSFPASGNTLLGYRYSEQAV